MTKAWFLAAVTAGTILSLSCSDNHAPGVVGSSAGGNVGTTGGHIGHGGSKNNDAGHASGGSPEAGAGDSGSAGEVGASGAETAGSAGTSATSGNGGGPNPPVGDPPICSHHAKHGAGSKIQLSGSGNDLLQAVTPDELTLAWKNGNNFFVADRPSFGDAFGASKQVTGASQFTAVSLSADGLTLIAVTKTLSVVELVRSPGGAFNAASADAGDFAEFDTTLSMIPSSNQELNDAVLSSDETSFFFSHYFGNTGSYATINESHRSGGAWTFASVPLGDVLNASDAKRRVPTGVSSDLLTLFYRDEVRGDFRAAWRVNRQVAFDYSEVVDLSQGVQAVVPSLSCLRLYYSGPGGNDLDLFVANVMN